MIRAREGVTHCGSLSMAIDLPKRNDLVYLKTASGPTVQLVQRLWLPFRSASSHPIGTDQPSASSPEGLLASWMLTLSPGSTALAGG